MLQTHGKFMKYVFFTLHRMTPEQMKMNPIKPIIKVKTNEELDTVEGESIGEEEKSTTSSDKSEQDSESDITTEDEEETNTSETLQIHDTYNTTMHDKDDLIHDEYDTSEDENIIEIETFEHYGEKIHETEESIPTEASQVLTVFNKTIHHEDDSSDENL